MDDEMMGDDTMFGMDPRERNLPIMSSQPRSPDQNDRILKPFASPSATLSSSTNDSPELAKLFQGPDTNLLQQNDERNNQSGSFSKDSSTESFLSKEEREAILEVRRRQRKISREEQEEEEEEEIPSFDFPSSSSKSLSETVSFPSSSSSSTEPSILFTSGVASGLQTRRPKERSLSLLQKETLISPKLTFSLPSPNASSSDSAEGFSLPKRIPKISSVGSMDSRGSGGSLELEDLLSNLAVEEEERQRPSNPIPGGKRSR